MSLLAISLCHVARAWMMFGEMKDEQKKKREREKERER
jgi:hypothetical protein